METSTCAHCTAGPLRKIDRRWLSLWSIAGTIGIARASSCCALGRVWHAQAEYLLVLFRELFAVYTEKMITQKLYLSTATLVRPSHLLLFGSGTSRSGRLAAVEGFLEFEAHPEACKVILATRACLSQLLSAKFENPDVDLTDASKPLIDATIRLAETRRP